MSGGNWATWEPGELVSPGDIGVFNSDRRFRSYRNLQDLGVNVVLSNDRRIGARFYKSAEGLVFRPKLVGQSAAGFDTLGEVDAGLRITANKSHACVLHIAAATEKSIVNQKEVLDCVLALLREGRWGIDWQLVIRRVQAERGFAAISRGSGQSIELKTAGNARILTESMDLGGAEVELASRHAAADFWLYEFGESATPIFDCPIRVRHDLWHRLLPWPTDGRYLVDPAGKRYCPRDLPSDLSALPLEARRYDPACAAMPLEELAALTAEQVLERVSSLPEDTDRGVNEARPVQPDRIATLDGVKVSSFPLPLPGEHAPLAAAADTSYASVLVSAASPDKAAEFTLHDHDREYWLEVTLAPSVSLPAVVLLRYGTIDGTERDILIPVADDGTGQPGSAVRLRRYMAGATWRAWPPVPPGNVRAWPDELVAESIGAAVTVATAQAWEHLAIALPSDAGALITRELGVRRNSP